MLSYKILVCICLASQVKGDNLKCPLVWREMNIGDSVPENSIPAALFGTTQLVARALMGEGIYVLGRWENGTVFSSVAEQVVPSITYEILTNPYKCVLNWAPKTTTDFTIPPADNQTGSRVGRTIADDVLLIGQSSSEYIHFVTISQETNVSLNFEVLQSYSKGLSLTVNNFIFKNDPFNARPDILGFDEIVNNSPATVKQSVYHKKRIYQHSKITKTETWGLVGNIKMDVNGKVSSTICDEDVGYEMNKSIFNKEWETGDEEVNEIVDSNEVVIESKREVSVPPYTSINFCTMVTVYENFNAEYEADGIYSSPGLTSTEVAEILARDELRGVPNGDTIVVQRKGIFSGNLAMSTEFITSRSGAPGGCMQLSTLIGKFKRDRAFQRIASNDDYRQRLSEINNNYYGLIKPPCFAENSTTIITAGTTTTARPSSSHHLQF